MAGCLATFGATTPSLAASLAYTTLLRPPDFRRYWTASAIGSSIPARFSFGATSVISPAPPPPAAPVFLVAAVAGLATPLRDGLAPGRAAFAEGAYRPVRLVAAVAGLAPAAGPLLSSSPPAPPRKS